MAIFATGDSPALQEDRKLDLIGALAALAVLVRLGLFVINEPFYEGDTRLLVTGHIDAISACLREGRWFGCSGSGVFPLLQNVPSLFLWYRLLTGRHSSRACLSKFHFVCRLGGADFLDASEEGVED